MRSLIFNVQVGDDETSWKTFHQNFMEITKTISMAEELGVTPCEYISLLDEGKHNSTKTIREVLEMYPKNKPPKLSRLELVEQ